MRTIFKTAAIGTFALALHATIVVSEVNAQCGVPQWNNAWNDAWTIQPLSSKAAAEPGPAPFQVAESRESSADQDQIVGFWKFKFVSEGSTGIPDGAVIDNGLVQWHADGTEITNSSRPPATSSFCLGVWQKSGSSKYALNHFALSSDLSGNFIGPAQIRETITLNHKANQYDGTFTIDQYDTAGHVLAHVTGRVTGTRITVDTTVADIF